MEPAASAADAAPSPKVDYQTHPDRYKHYKVSYDGPIATLSIDIDEDAGIRPGYKLKLNSYDLGVDIELHDAVQRIRFEHPEVRTVVLTARRTGSSAPAPTSSCSAVVARVEGELLQVHQRDAQRDGGSSRHSGLKFLAACNGTTRGGGYEWRSRATRSS
jgi:benzoyl-CoA-dihydrodiol lyase